MAEIYGRSLDEERGASGWAIGWTIFAGVMMIVQGLWWAIAGATSLFNGQFYLVGEEYIFRFDVTTWGWIHLVLGLVVFVAGFGLFNGAGWARTTGVVIATISMLIAFVWLPWYPIWAVLFIGISMAVIWSLTVHGRDITDL